MPYPVKIPSNPNNDNTFNVNSLNAPIKRPYKKGRDNIRQINFRTKLLRISRYFKNDKRVN